MRNRALAVIALATLVGVLVAPSAHADAQACVDTSERAQALRDEGKLRAARAELLNCAVETCPQVIQTDCHQWLAEVESRMPSVIFSVRDSTGNDVGAARVLIDGSLLVSRLDGKSVPVDPGEHTFRFEPEHGSPVEQRVIIRENDKGRLLAIVLPALDSRVDAPHGAHSSPPEQASGQRSIPTATYILGGVSLIGAAGFAYFWLSAVGDAKDLQATCASRGCTESDLSPPRTKALVADISLGVGVAAATGALMFFVLQKPSDRAVSLGVAPSKESLLLSLRRTF